MGEKWTRRGFLAGSGAAVAGTFLLDFQTALTALAAPSDEDGYELWLRYRVVDRPDLLASYRQALTHVVVPGEVGGVERSAIDELVRGLSGLLGREIPGETSPAGDGVVIVGTPESSPLIAESVDAGELSELGPEGYVLRRRRVNGHDAVLVASEGERGVLYGAFHLLRLLQTSQWIDQLDITERPANPLRLANHWDYLNRVVQWGLAGLSIFHWEDLPETRPRYTDYARALASIGMNGTVVNIVNAEHEFVSTDMIQSLTGLAEVLRAWGLKLYLSINFRSPIEVGDLPTADPLDDDVRAWWSAKVDEIYAVIPDFGGFLIKADSEGQPGPQAYGRTHADGANMLAEALRPHGGIVMWRAFVGHEFGGEIAMAAYAEFEPLDGEFADNAIVQIKFGPIDFQVREPAHPLFGAMPNTNLMLELQILQEYTGQATHVCYLVPMWKEEVYDFDTYADGEGTTVAKVVDGSAFGYAHSGVAGVMNFGDDPNWTGLHLAAANTHGFGRLAWNPGLDAAEIAEEWVRMTFGSHSQLVQVLTRMLLSSREIYESYTAPLMGGFTGRNHPSRSFHGANAEAIGTDRTVATGTGMTDLYHSPVSEIFDSLDTCPEELLLFFHRVPYDHELKSGTTLIQHIYDSYFEGLEDVRRLRRLWQAFGSRVDARRHQEVLDQFDRQIEHATLWRDTCVDSLFGLNRILDEQRSWVQVRLPGSSILAPTPSLLLEGGWPNQLQLRAGNASPQEQEITVGLATPEGWISTTDSIALASRQLDTLTVSVTPPLAPQAGTIRPDVDTDGLVLGTTDTPVMTAPAGLRCVLALDAAPPSPAVPVFTGYRRLSPSDTWDPERGYGWVGTAPQAVRRGGGDALRGTYIYDIAPRTLRIAVPPGSYDAYVLVGDVWWSPIYPTYVRSDGELLAESEEHLAGNDYTWLRFTLDGGSTGREVDLEFSTVDYRWEFPQQHFTTGAWHLNALALVDPTAEMPAVAVTDVESSSVMFGGRENTVSATVVNTTDSEDIAVTARVLGPEGWSSQDATETVPAGQTIQVDVLVTPPTDPTLPTTLQVEVTAEDHEIAGGSWDIELIAIPPGDDAVLALDGGSAASPVVETYERLAPEHAWDPARGFGWVDGTPQSRDRGGPLDVLRRDFCNDAVAATLRLAVPAGSHDVYLLVGDTVFARPTFVRSEGELLAESPFMGGGEFVWLQFTLDGGAGGREVDLELASEPGQHWHLNALVMA